MAERGGGRADGAADGRVTKVAGVDVHLDLRGPGLREGLMSALRDAIRGGRLAAGTKLPSSRSLAIDLGLARNTVALAYAELVAEGWLTARQGATTRVAQRAPGEPAPAAPPPRPPRRHVHDLRPGMPDLSAFPRAEWSKAIRRALAEAPDEDFGYSGPLGMPKLRAALSRYLARTRGVHAPPDRIVVCSGASHGLVLLTQALRDRGVRELAVEAYGLSAHRQLVERLDVRTRPIGVDRHGARVAELDSLPSAGAVLLTPSHQFPTGVALHPDRRAAVVGWARRAGGFVDALARHSPEARVTGMAAGLHVLVELPSGNESAVVRGSAWQDLAVHGLAAFRHPGVAPDRDALVIGYGTPSASAWPGALEALCRVLP